MPKPLFLFIIFLLVNTTLFSQNSKSDSLEVKLVLVEDSLKPDILPKLIREYINENDFDNAYRNALELLKLSEEEGSIIKQIEALSLLGISYQQLVSNHEKSLDYLLQALELAEENNFSTEQVEILMLISDDFKDIKDHYGALDYLLKAENELERFKNKRVKADLFFEISQTYSQLNDSERALSYLNEACTLASELDATTLRNRCYFLQSQYFQLVGNINEAIKELESVVTTHNKTVYWEVHFQKGVLLKKQSKLQESLSYFSKALNQNEVSLQSKAKLYIELGDLFLKKELPDSSFYYLSKGLEYSVQTNSKDLILDCYDNLYHYYLQIGDFDNADEYKNLFVEISEFINTEEVGQEMGELQTKYEIGKKEKEIEVLQKDREIQQLTILKQKNERSLLLLGISILVIIALAGFWLFRIKQKGNEKLKEVNDKIELQNLELQELNATKDKFFSIIGHDIKGPLNSLTSFSSLLINHSGSLSQEEIRTLAIDIDKSLKNLFNLLENLLNWARSQSGNIDIKPERLELKNLVQNNMELLQKTAQNKSIEIQDLTKNQVIQGDKNTINTVIRNLLSNALKFTPQGGKITFRTFEENGIVNLSITDSGVGMSIEQQNKLFKVGEKVSTLGTEKEKGTGLGLILCKEFMELNNGGISVNSKEEEGSTFTLHFQTS